MKQICFSKGQDSLGDHPAYRFLCCLKSVVIKRGRYRKPQKTPASLNPHYDVSVVLTNTHIKSSICPCAPFQSHQIPTNNRYPNFCHDNFLAFLCSLWIPRQHHFISLIFLCFDRLIIYSFLLHAFLPLSCPSDSPAEPLELLELRWLPASILRDGHTQHGPACHSSLVLPALGDLDPEVWLDTDFQIRSLWHDGKKRWSVLSLGAHAVWLSISLL